EPGTCCVIPQNMSHRTRPMPGHERIELIDLRIAAAPATPLSRYVQNLPVGTAAAPPERLREIAHRLAAQTAGAREPGEATLTAAAWSLLALYEAPAQHANAQPAPHDPRLEHAHVLMRDHLDQPLSIETLAARVNLSASRLRQLMIQHYGMPPQERYLQLRL